MRAFPLWEISKLSVLPRPRGGAFFCADARVCANAGRARARWHIERHLARMGKPDAQEKAHARAVEPAHLPALSRTALRRRIEARAGAGARARRLLCGPVRAGHDRTIKLRGARGRA